MLWPASNGERLLELNTCHNPRGPKGGQFCSKYDMRPATAADADRIKALRVPPAWKQVLVSTDPDSELQVSGVDAKGRRQSLYSSEHTAKAAAEKFARLKDFHRDLPAIRSRIKRDLGRVEEAAVLHLIDETGFRVGGEGRTGAATLQTQHARVHGDEVTFRFTGKSGVRVQRTLENAALARIIGPRLTGVRGPLFQTTPAKVREYLNSFAPDFTPKDFRTWRGTSTALAAMAKMAFPRTAKAFKRAQRAVAKIASRALGNTPSVALKSYIDPGVWGSWQAARTS